MAHAEAWTRGRGYHWTVELDGLQLFLQEISRYRLLIRARRSSAALRSGAFQLLASGNGSVLAFTRTTADEQALVVHNLAGSMQNAGPFPTAATAYDTVFADPGATLSLVGGTGRASLPARASAVWRLK